MDAELKPQWQEVIDYIKRHSIDFDAKEFEALAKKCLKNRKAFDRVERTLIE